MSARKLNAGHSAPAGPPSILLGKTIVSLGEMVKCKPPKGHPFAAKLLHITLDPAGYPIAVNVYGGKAGKAGTRTFPVDSITPIKKRRTQHEE